MTPIPHPPGPAVRLMAALAASTAATLWCTGSVLANEPVPPKLVLPAKTPRAEKTPARPSAQPAAKAAAKLAPEDLPPPAAEAEAPAPTDPLELLRQRLADRLSGGTASSPGGPYDVRISTRSTLSPAAPAAKAAARPAGKAARPGHGPGAGAVHWSYQGEAGPAAWGGLKSDYSLCKTGERQSPIDIRGGLAVNLDPVRFDYQASKFAVQDNGHTVQVKLAPGNSIDIGGRRFELQQFHFHRPSEERIDGRQFEMSLHLVHKDEQGKLAVVALLFDQGPPNAVVQNVWNNLPLERGDANPAREALELAALLPNDRRYYTYMGSLTTPPCSEGVQWIVMRTPQSLTAEQIAIFSRIYPMNARPLQSAAGRRILQSD
jgi:carbonic anhydrase